MPIDNETRKLLTSGFRFVISIDDSAVAAFTECTLPTMEIETEQVKEGGLNTYAHTLPGSCKPGQITLKNGIGVIKDLQGWYVKTMKGQFTRKRISVTVLSAKLEPVFTLDINDAYPTKWSGPQLRTDDKSVAIQTLVLSCGEISVRE